MEVLKTTLPERFFTLIDKKSILLHPKNKMEMPKTITKSRHN